MVEVPAALHRLDLVGVARADCDQPVCCCNATLQAGMLCFGQGATASPPNVGRPSCHTLRLDP